ncbi:rho GTPase-activating protein 11A [Trichonephila clavata]|uniref:Rho GTPase-activating protein 11A n=1 Tax=Trichonephila clavata TaxID=2740835 RepID=A0A8X6KSA9_TRICU|nr:rho GTPase-activating protein 11A [Trichonephila clavata]
MKYFEDKDDLYTTIFAELKNMGVKVPKVKKFKSNISKQERTLLPSNNKIFGVNLGEQEWTSDFDYLLPKFIASSTAYLQNFTKEVGIFRKAGSKARQRELRLKLEKGEMLDGSEPNDVAALLKQWLRELPEPLIPQYMHDLFVRCQQLDNNENRVTASLLTCLLLPPDHLHTFKYLMCFLAEFAANSNINLMGSHNLALIMAPNIFTSSTDTVDKSSYSSNLVQVHASAIQLLIENATKIGDVSEFASFQHSAQEGKSCSELDSSGDVLDSSPYKGRKKEKSGHVQDLFSGIRKLVGQNATPGNSLKTPEKFWNTLRSAPRSASKRKADPDQQSVSPVKKQAKSVNDKDEIFLSATPKDKGGRNCGTVGRSGGHTRKKSFGLLRKKERKRQKSVIENSQPVVSINVTSPEHCNAESKNNVLVKSTRSSVGSTSSVFGNSSQKLSKSESIKKSTSDCYLTPKVKTQRLSLPSSQGCETKFEISLHYLHPSKVVNEKPQSPAQEYASLQLNVQNMLKANEKIKKKNLSQMHEMHTDTETTLSSQAHLNKASKVSNKSPVQKKSSPGPSIREIKNGELCQKISCNISVNDKSGSNEKVSYNTRASLSNLNHRSRISSSKMNIDHPENSESRSVSDSHIKRSSTKTSKRSPNKERLSQKGLSRQEAFIVKSKKQITNHSDQLENTETKPEKIHKKSHVYRAIGSETAANPLRKSQSVTLDSSDKNKIKKKVTRKTSRKGSIVRGQPNTVKSGLRSELRGSESLLVTSDFCENKVFTKSNDLANKTVRPRRSLGSPCIVDVPETIDNVSDPKDISLSLKFENFTLSSPTSISDNLIDFVNNMFSQGDNSEDISKNKRSKSEKKLSLQSKSEKPQDSKIPRLRNSLEVERTDSFSEATSEPKRRVSKSRGSNSSSSSSSSKIPIKCKENFLDISSFQVSMNDSCFKTPDKNGFPSPNSVTWMSGSKYLGINSPQDEAFNKRESIALILKNNPGHVQAKVSMYDTRVRDSVFCTRSVPTFSTPFENSDSRETKSSQKHHSGLQKSHGKVYESKSCDSSDKRSYGRPKRKSRRSPQPPPPKFDFNESIALSTPNVSNPFKEATNASLGLNESLSPQNTTSINNENSILKQSFNINLSKENINTMGLNMSRTSANASMKDGNISKRSPMKEVTNISFGLNESHNSLIKEEGFILEQLSKINVNAKKTQKLKRNSFSVNSPSKRSKKVFRSGSSPGRRLRDKVSNLVQNSTPKSASIILEANFQNECFISNSRVLRSSNSKSGNL